MKKQVVQTLSFVLVIVLAAAAGLFWLRSRDQHAHEHKPSVSESGKLEALPDFEIVQLGATSPTKLSQLEGRVFLLNFWATWCASCVIELPSLVKLRERFRGRGFEVVGINLDDHESPEIQEMIQRLGVSFPNYRDPSQKFVDYMNVSEIPFTLVIDRDRKILFQYLGDQNWDSASVHQRVEGWLK